MYRLINRNIAFSTKKHSVAEILRDTDMHTRHLPDKADDVELFAKCIAGDDAAAVSLFNQYNPRLYAYCVKMLGDRENAKDVSQDVWRRVLNLRRAPVEVRIPFTFLITIARNLCIDSMRARRNVISMDESEAELELLASERPMSQMEEIAVAALESLPDEYREPLVLNIYCGYRYDEIATMLGCTPDAVWQRASRARSKLRRIVAAALDKAGLKEKD